jgi:hypothetical protein
LISIIQINGHTLVELKNKQGEKSFVQLKGEPDIPEVLKTTLMVLRLNEIQTDLKSIRPQSTP